jgi:glycosyltransferase involved in cell wall biosynthesis
MKRILFIIQLPPPVHGAAVANDILVNSPLVGAHFAGKHINISIANKIEDIGKFAPSKLLSAARHLALIIKRMLFFRPDMVYLTLSPSGFAFYRDAVYIRAIRLFRPKLVLHLHGKGIESGTKKSRLFRWLSKRIFKGSYVIFLSEGLRSDVPFSFRQSFVVNYGLPVSTSRQKPAAPENQAVRLLYLSNYVQTKGVLDLIDALGIVAATHNDFTCDLVGKPYDLSIDFLTGYIRKKNLQDHMRVLGPRYKAEKNELLEAADIFILPTFYENEAFPLSILEAMQYALPVISTFEGGIPDMIDDGVNGLLFRQRDIDDLAKKIIFLLDHPETRSQLGLAARKKFIDRFTVSIFEQNMLNVFQQVSGSAT